MNAVSFFAVLIALQLVRLPERERRPEVLTLRRRLADGFKATVNDRNARFAVACISVVALTASPFIALVPAMALEVFHSKAGGTSILITAQGIGAVGGALIITPLIGRYGRRRVLAGDLAGVCGFLVLYGLAPDLWLGALALFLVGASYIGVLAGCNTIVQLNAPAEMRGRMLGIYMMALGVLYPVGALAQGWLAGWAGLRAVTAGGAAVLLAVVGLAVLAGVVPARLDGPDVVELQAA
jgi:MFS family permease